jgi:hypothetical protein
MGGTCSLKFPNLKDVPGLTVWPGCGLTPLLVAQLARKRLRTRHKDPTEKIILFFANFINSSLSQ